ncbi:ribonuclease HII [Candidatus Saccharibacteria bacterium]|nr:ribonuclease HII [Candidatus Saccharibacteria bacterium]
MAILGIDEVGRGPLAGPLVVGAVILPVDADGSRPEWVEELRDSKKLSVKKREALSEVILKEATACGLGWVAASEIDEVGISQALVLATSRAVKSVQGLHAAFSQIVIDGKVNFLRETKLSDFVSTMPKADDLVKEVSAASIIAKVARDHYMYDLDTKYPGYGFSSHVGYGTTKHIAAIRELGVTPEHRKSFEPIKSMVGFKRGDKSVGAVKNTTLVGGRGEEAVCGHLVSYGHKILERNFKTKFCEIDIVSLCDGKLYFTEVKTRKNSDFGGGFGAIDKKKLERMKFASEVFLKARPSYQKYNPLLAAAAVDGEFRVLDWLVIR